MGYNKNMPQTLLPEAQARIDAFLNFKQLPEWAHKSIRWLMEQENWEALNDRFYRELPFGTAGMRGPTLLPVMTPFETAGSEGIERAKHAAVGTNTLNDFLIIRATVGLYRFCQETEGAGPLKLVIAHDVRFFSKHFAELTASTWTQLGGQAALFKYAHSTPQLSFALRQMGAHLGVVITASHNPPEDNGYKVYFKDGGQAVGPQMAAAIEKIRSIPLESVFGFLEKHLSGVATLDKDSDDAYIAMLKSSALDPVRLKEFSPKLVFSPLHGTGQMIAPRLFTQMGVKVSLVESQQTLDPRFLTVKSPNPESEEAFTLALEKAKQVDADLAIAFDPDADRMGVAVKVKPQEYRLLSGNTLGALITAFRIQELERLGWLKHKDRCVVIKTFVTTPLIDAIAQNAGIPCVETLTGFKWIGQKLKHYEALFFKNAPGRTLPEDPKQRALAMQDHSRFFILGAEESYGYLINDAVRDKDAHSCALLVCELFAWLAQQRKTLHDFETELYLKHGYFSESLLNIYYPGNEGSVKIQNIISSYRKSPPQRIGTSKVLSIRDFGSSTQKDLDGETLAPENFFIVELDNGYRVALRASGTEPKIKYYLFGHQFVSSQSQLETARLQVKTHLNELKKILTQDANARAGV